MPNLTGYWSLLYQIPIGLLGLSFLVFIHEGGHFLVAKKLGVKVNTFSIGFGKKLISWKRGETEYCISAIPLGGYVAMAGEQPDDEGSGDGEAGERDFRAQSIPTRMAIAFAGPAVNLTFSFLILAILYFVGVQEPAFNMMVGDVEKGSAAEKADIRRGDEILTLKGKPVKDWEALMQDFAIQGENPASIQVRRGQDVLDKQITPVMYAKLGIAMAGLSGETLVHVDKIIPGKPAEQMGLQVKDQILSIDGFKVSSPTALVELINASKGQEMALKIKRGTEEKSLMIKPIQDPGSQRYIIGIYPGLSVPMLSVKRGFGASIEKSFQKNLEFGSAMFHTLKGIVTGQIKAKALSGPIGILQIIANSFHYGLQRFVEFMALISTNLGVMNLLPLAITDGGVIFFLIIEAIRRKPLKLTTQMRINQVAVSLFIMLALFVTFHDIKRIPWFLN